MPDVTLTLKANNDDYVRKMKEAQQASQKVYDTVNNGAKREKGLIEDIEGELSRLQEARKKAYRIEDIEKYNRKIQEATKDLKEYEQAGIKSQKATESLTASIGKWALSLGGATMILKKLMDALKDTIGGMNLLNQIGAVTKQVMNDIVTGVGISMTNIQAAIKMQRQMNALRTEEYLDNIKVAKLNIIYQQQYVRALDQTLTQQEQLEAINMAMEAHNKAINIQIEDIKKAKTALEELKNPTQTQIKWLSELIVQEKNLEAEKDASTKRLQSRRSGIYKEAFEGYKTARANFDQAIKQWEDDLNKEIEDAEKKRLDIKKQYLGLAQKLIDEYDKSMIDSLTGKEKLEAQREFGIKQIKEFRDQIAKLGPITDEMNKQLQTMADNVWKAFYNGMAKEATVTPEQKKAISENLLKGLPTLEGLQKSYINTTPGTEPEDFSIWRLIGLDPENDDNAKMIESIKDAYRQIQDVIQSSLDQRVEIAQRDREILDQRINETQEALSQEIELYKAGYASNVTAKREELSKLQIEREKALANEEKAIKRRMTMETMLQAVNLASAAANVFTTVKDLGTLAIAVGVVTALMAAFAMAKKNAQSATKLAEGGSGTDTGIVTGRKHSEGGEGFLSHVEVERGEAWGVLSAPATQRYGKVFHNMVSSFNRGQMPEVVKNINNNRVSVENSGPNSRLDKVITEQRKLNDQILRQSQIVNINGKKVIKNGNKIRVVG